MSKIQSPELTLAVNAVYHVAESLELSERERQFLLCPDGETTFTVPYLASGQRASAQAYLTTFWPRPSRGGVRIDPNVTMEQIRAGALNLRGKHALWTDAENWYLEGGGMLGLSLDRTALTPDEYIFAIRSFARTLGERVGAGVHIMGPDFGADQRTMAIMMDERASRRFEPDAFSGKPPLSGGRTTREPATGYGGAVAAAVAAPRLGLRLEGATAAVVGFGAAGAPAARHLVERGARIVAAMNIQGAVVGRSVDTDALEQWVRVDHRDLTAFPGAQSMPAEEAMDEVMSMEVDVLVLAAKAGMVTADVARRIGARIVVEVVPAAVTPDGEAVLLDREKLVVPELIAGALGAYASALELRGFDPQGIWARLENKAWDINSRVHDLAGSTGFTLRTAAWQIALRRLLGHGRDCGLI